MTEPSLKIYTPADIVRVAREQYSKRITANTVREYIRAGKLPAQKAGNTWLVSEENLHTFLSQYTDGRAGKPRSPAWSEARKQTFAQKRAEKATPEPTNLNDNIPNS